jgi:Tfp pilus assembly protein PilO
MDRNRLWMLGAAVLICAIAVLGWLLGIAPKLSEASAANTERANVEVQNATYHNQLAALKTQFENIGDLKSKLAGLREAVPAEPEIPALIGQLGAIGQQHEVTLTSIIVSDAQPYAPEVRAAPAPVEATPAGTTAAPAAGAPAAGTEAAAADTGAAAASTPAAPAAPAPPATPVVPVSAEAQARVTAGNFVAVPISLSVAGGYDNVLAFIEGLQKGTRLAMVTTFTTSAADPSAAPAAVGENGTPPAGTDRVTATISAFVYVVLDTSAVVPQVAG